MLILKSMIICGCFVGMMLPSSSSSSAKSASKNNTNNYDVDHNPVINWSERISFGDKQAIYRLGPTSWANDLNDLIQYLIDNDLHQPLLIELPNRMRIMFGENLSAGNNVVAENYLDNRPLNRECTIIVTVVASVCLLLFSALTLSLIIIKKKRSADPKDKPEPHSTNLVFDTRGVLPQRFPKKSSLKKPSNEFPVQDSKDQTLETDKDDNDDQTEGGEIVDGAKRKSIVKFDEKSLKK